MAYLLSPRTREDGVLEEVCTVSLQSPVSSPQDGERHLLFSHFGAYSKGSTFTAASGLAATPAGNRTFPTQNGTSFPQTMCRIDRTGSDVWVTMLFVLLYVLSLVPLASAYVLQEKMLREKADEVDVSLVFYTYIRYVWNP